jgi:hypothetical protein
LNRGAQRGQNPVFGLAQAAAVTGARRRGGRLQERAGAGRGGEKEVHERSQNETGQSAIRVFIKYCGVGTDFFGQFYASKLLD